ncbi:hypothetical protein U2F26_31960 [Micromonospora sp. 4G57]|uniref:Uncharacterized protein n=1 Tax=Micromonospora sicca TaxID=2202420 RepID=A0ABU5JNL1_9ACTN|nr:MULTISPECIES: hypothetical protein [unclassified Micromonospora]MDZ5447272.1 hypothetical protein [Micromonospora sp. 4G57]MDZ5493968.1 hypothetical protein [Micromonospora sp. 4G53]
MRSRHRAAAIRAALTAVEHDANTRGWDALPALLGLFDVTTHRHQPRIDIDALSVDPAFWWLHAQTVPGMRLPYWVGLKTLTAHLTAAEGAPLLAQWAHTGQRRLLGMAFLGEGLDTSDAGRRAAAAHGPPLDDDGVPVRALTACDIDGRHYQILRYRGVGTTRTLVLDDPPARVRATVIPACLRRLLTAARA